MQLTKWGKISKWLQSPFPFYGNYQQKILIPIVLSVLVMAGIVLLNYTGSSDPLLTQIYEVLSYGIIIIVISLFLSLVLPEFFPKVFNAETWTVQKTIFYIFISILIIGTSLSLYAYQYKNPNNLSFYFFFFFILKRSVILSFFPILTIIFYAERKLHKKNHLQALEIINDLNKQRGNKQKATKNVTIIFAKDTNDELSICENKLLYIKAEGNYCRIVYEGKSAIKEKLIRSSLKNIEHIINKPETFVRCHKSYIVNSNRVTSVTGNAKGHLFTLENYNHPIPISRNFSKLILKKIKKHTQE